MAEKKKIFNESDFDKDKQLFSSEDFEKEKDVPTGADTNDSDTRTSEPDPRPSKGYGKVIGGIIGVAAVCLLGYGVFSYMNQPDDTPGTTITDGGGVTDGGTTEGGSTDGGGVTDGGTTEGGNTDDGGVTDGGTTEGGSTDGGGVTDGGTTEGGNTDDGGVTDGGTTEGGNTDDGGTTDAGTTIGNNGNDQKTATIPSGTLEEKAKDVIRGNYGNGEVRKQKLGDQYAEIQGKVNEMYRNGLVK